MSQKTASQKLALEQRKTYESLDLLRRRFARMCGQGLMLPVTLTVLVDRLDEINKVIAALEPISIPVETPDGC